MDDFLPVTRRGLLKASAAAGAIGLVGNPLSVVEAATRSPLPDREPQMVSTALTVNGRLHELSVDSRTTLLDALREHMDLTGSKKGCDHGQCGACTVLVNGRRINSCLTLAAMHERDTITTIEGIGTPDHLHPMQASFIEHDGCQCGYCTVGQICSAIGMIHEYREGMPSHITEDLSSTPSLSDEEIRERMSGNLCRCAAYPNIVAAIKDAERAT